MSSCQFHPIVAATKSCDACQASYCDDCSDESPTFRDADAENVCFVCGGSMQSLKTANAVEPFWRRLGDVYKYPLEVQSLTVISITSFLSALLINSWLLQLLPLAAITLYGFACLRETAGGKLQAPDVEKCFEGSLNPIIYVFLAIIFALFVTGVVGALLGVAFAALLSGLFIGILPAAIMVIAITERLLPALNIGRLMGVVQATGSSYFIMLLFLIIMMSSVALLSSVLGVEKPSFGNVFLQAVVSNYYLVVEYHLLGYLVFQHHQELGFKTKTHRSKTLRRTDEQRDLAKLDVLIKVGDYESAKELAVRILSTSNASAMQWDRTFRLMCAGRSTKELSSFWPKYARKLEGENRADTMADAYVECKKRLPELVIKSETMRLTLAESLFDLGRYNYVAEMLNSFHTQSQDHAMVDRALVLLADSFERITNGQKNARFYRQLIDLRKNSN